MISVIAHTEEEVVYLIDSTHVLSDEGVIDRIRTIERVIWTNQGLSSEELNRLHRYSRALREEAWKRMRGVHYGQVVSSYLPEPPNDSHLLAWV